MIVLRVKPRAVLRRFVRCVMPAIGTRGWVMCVRRVRRVKLRPRIERPALFVRPDIGLVTAPVPVLRAVLVPRLWLAPLIVRRVPQASGHPLPLAAAQIARPVRVQTLRTAPAQPV